MATAASYWWDLFGSGNYVGPYDTTTWTQPQKNALAAVHSDDTQPWLSFFTTWGLLLDDLSLLFVTILSVGAAVGAWPQQRSGKHDPVPSNIASFAKWTSIVEQVTFAIDICIVTVYWALLWPENNKDIPGGIQGWDLFFPLLDHAVLPGIFFLEYLTSRVPIDQDIG